MAKKKVLTYGEQIAAAAANMTKDRAAAIVASAYNQSAALPGNEDMRTRYPSGMRPADTQREERWFVRHILVMWLDVYRNRLSKQELADQLYSRAECQCALDFLSTPVPGTVGAL